ncbi:MAG: hypothetical protein Q9219_006106 [cf. Caloplaca sp. 3 TL-2023]
MERIVKYFKGTRAQEHNNYVCAFISQDILEKLKESDQIDEESRKIVQETIEFGNEEATKEREDVGEKDKNPHEPNLPPDLVDEKRPRPGPPKALYEKQSMDCASVSIYDGQHLKEPAELPGALRRRYGEPAVDDKTVNVCYDAVNKAQEFFRNNYGWDSVDDKNHPIVGTVHFGEKLANAFWFAGHNQMMYGDGFELMTNFVGSYEVVGHELTHGIVQFSSGLIYEGMSGALSEHVADVMGTLLEQWVHNLPADQADWLLAQDVLLPDNPKVAMRSMKAPGTAYDDPRIGKDTQPGHMQDYLFTPHDHGGVHANSGIPNHAFYLAATRFGGNAWEVPGRTWFAAMTTAKPRETFWDFAGRTVAEAEKETSHPTWAGIVEQAWIDVGIVRRKTSWYDRMWEWMGCGRSIVLNEDTLEEIRREYRNDEKH